VTKTAFLLATAAVAWGAAFLAWALLGSAYSSGDPLADAGNPVAVALATVPLLVAVAAWSYLHRSCSLGRSTRPVTAIALVAGAFSILSAASIGMVLAPLALLIGLAVATVEPARPTA
jgi:hypothetical protein